MTSRRDAVRALAGFAALPMLQKLGVGDVVEVGQHGHAVAELRRKAATAAPRALTAAEYDMVVAAAERIIPRTTTPGATDAHVADFIDVMLADWYEPAETADFKRGLPELDTRAQAISGRPFVQTPAAQQTNVLETLDAELQVRRNAKTSDADDHWFAMLKHLTVWGYYTSEVGITKELRVQVMPGYYDGNAQYPA